MFQTVRKCLMMALFLLAGSVAQAQTVPGSAPCNVTDPSNVSCNGTLSFVVPLGTEMPSFTILGTSAASAGWTFFNVGISQLDSVNFALSAVPPTNTFTVANMPVGSVGAKHIEFIDPVTSQAWSFTLPTPAVEGSYSLTYALSGAIVRAAGPEPLAMGLTMTPSLVAVSVVPEPKTLMMWLAGLGLVAWVHNRRKPQVNRPSWTLGLRGLRPA